jgi:hypothetical protein
MASFTKLDDNNVVLAVVSVHDNELLDENGNESEQKGIDFLIGWSGGYTKWKQTSFNTVGGVHSNGGTPFRKNYAGVGYTYDEQRDAFIPPKLFASWSLNENTCQWQPPVPMPTDGKFYIWNEDAQSWAELTTQ